VSAAVNNTIQPDQYFELVKSVDRMSDDLLARFRAEKVDSGNYISGKRFLEDLRDSLKVLEQPNAASYFNGSFAARGQNVEELAVHMTEKGLKFAPMSPGGEAAYQSLFSAMVAYAGGGPSDAGFRMRTATWAQNQGITVPKGPPPRP
jgi:hypothetical protein